LTLTVKKAMDILDCLGRAQAPLAPSELGRRLEIPRSTVFRLLITLRTRGYVTQDLVNPEKYRLGFKIVELASSLLDLIELRQQAAPFLTANTITDLATLHQELDKVRHRGFVVDNLENEEGIRCAGAPVFDHKDQPVAAVSVSGPSYRMTLERTQALGQAVRQASQGISQQLGHSRSWVETGDSA
jgi:DNA-binding IclR family transcriptional regulator